MHVYVYLFYQVIMCLLEVKPGIGPGALLFHTFNRRRYKCFSCIHVCSNMYKVLGVWWEVT